MKKCKKCKLLCILLCLTGVAGVIVYIFWDKIKAQIFNSKYEDQILKLIDIARLAWDLINWPIDYVRALLP